MRSTWRASWKVLWRTGQRLSRPSTRPKALTCRSDSGETDERLDESRTRYDLLRQAMPAMREQGRLLRRWIGRNVSQHLLCERSVRGWLQPHGAGSLHQPRRTADQGVEAWRPLPSATREVE